MAMRSARAQVRFGRGGRRRRPARLGGFLDGAQTLGQFSVGGGAGHQRSAERRLAGAGHADLAAHCAAGRRPSGGASPTATECLPLPVSLCGMYSSSTAWKLVPPNPNALTPARRTPSAVSVHGRSSRVDVQRRVREIDIRDWDARSARWAAAPCRAAPARFSGCRRRRRAPFKMPDVRFDRSERDRASVGRRAP